MQTRRIRLFIALLISVAGHLAILYRAPEPIIIPLEEPSYSIEVNVSSTPSNTNILEALQDKDKGFKESIPATSSKANNEHLNESIKKSTQDQAGSNESILREKSSVAHVKITSHKNETLKTDKKSTHRLNTHTIQKNATPPKEIEGIKNSPVEESEKTPDQHEDLTPSKITATKEKKKKIRQNSGDIQSVKSKQITTQPVLTSTEQYEAQVLAWITNKQSDKLKTLPGEKTKPTTIKATWWRNGTIIYASVISSSGINRVDRAIKQKVLLASPLPPVPKDIKGKEYTMEIPLNFFDDN